MKFDVLIVELSSFWRCAEELFKILSGFQELFKICSRIDVEEEYGHWELIGCYDVRIVIRLHHDEFWSVIAFATVFGTAW